MMFHCPRTEHAVHDAEGPSVGGLGRNEAEPNRHEHVCAEERRTLERPGVRCVRRLGLAARLCF